MIRLIFLIILLAISVGIGIQLHAEPGYVLVAVHQWTAETTLWVAFIITLFAFALLYLSLTCLHGFLHLPITWKVWYTKRQTQRAREKTRQGLIEFSEGHWPQAQQYLLEALPHADTPLINYLTAARAAQEMGQNELRDQYLRQAQKSTPEAKIAVELTQAQLQLAHHQWEQALATLKHLQDLSPHHPYVLKLLMHLYEEIKDWAQLIALLPELKRYHVVSGNQLKAVQQRAYHGALQDLLKQPQQPMAIQAWLKKLPTELQTDVAITAICAGHLLQHGAEKEAEAQLRQALKHTIDPVLLTGYSQLTLPEALTVAESFIKMAPHSAALYLCLAQLSFTQQLWGKAKTYVETSLKLSPTPQAYALLGQLLLQQHDNQGASKAFQHGLQLALK